MSKLRIFIAIVVFILLILIGIFLPWIWNTHASNPKKDFGTPPKSAETEADTAYTFHEFEGLSDFLSKSLISDLKECFPVYLSHIEKRNRKKGRTGKTRKRRNRNRNGPKSKGNWKQKQQKPLPNRPAKTSGVPAVKVRHKRKGPTLFAKKERLCSWKSICPSRKSQAVSSIRQTTGISRSWRLPKVIPP